MTILDAGIYTATHDDEAQQAVNIEGEGSDHHYIFISKCGLSGRIWMYDQVNCSRSCYLHLIKMIL